MSSSVTSKSVLPLLESYFGYTSLRPNQASVIDAVLSNDDVLFTAPTGHGKSLCFQLPALHFYHNSQKGCLTIVVSPLVSLMHNHVQALQQRNIPCALISSAESHSHNQSIISALQLKSKLPFALLYITPERLIMSSFLNILTKLYKSDQLAFVAVDEAHCISQWGHDFRTAYAKLGIVKQKFPQLSLIALTATATRVVKKDIIQSLNISNAVCIHTSFLRTNIRYTIKYADTMNSTVEDDICSYISNRHFQNGFFEKGIIYAFKRDTVDRLASLLQQNGIPASAYHAGLSNNQRKQAQDEFEKGECPVVVASTAFGMGIDVSAIRYVIHHSIPKSIEAFYQESGRAGRDGLDSDSIVYYSQRDSSFLRFLHDQMSMKKEDKHRKQTRDNALTKMEDFCTYTKCRRVALLDYFGESTTAEKVCGPHGCDVCNNKHTGSKKKKIEMNTRAHNSFRKASSSFQSPAAEFQTARSMLKVKQEEEKLNCKKFGLKRKRSNTHVEDIDDFSGDDGSTHGSNFQKAIDEFKFSNDLKSDLKQLERMEETEMKKEAKVSSSRTRDRLRQRLNDGSSGIGSSKHSKAKKASRKQVTLAAVGIRRSNQ